MIMAKVRERYWIPRLRGLVKEVRKNCMGCRRFIARPFPPANHAPLPTDRTIAGEPYSVIGVDFAGPLRYRLPDKSEAKSYLVIYACSLTRGMYLELLKSQETEEFLCSFKRFMARRGRPRIVYSDNGMTFKAAAAWIEKMRKEEKLQGLLQDYRIQWRFNLSKAPWWGGQYERLIGVFKSSFRRVVGKGFLSFQQLEEVVLDVELALNNRPLTYLEDDIQVPVLTPNSFLHPVLPVPTDLDPDEITNQQLRRQASRIRSAKEAMWKRWTREYLKTLREIHKSHSTEQSIIPSKGEIVIVAEENLNRNQWKLAKVLCHLTSKDGKVRGVKLQTATGELERPVQAIYPLELHTTPTEVAPPQLNPTAKPFGPQRRAAETTSDAIRAIAEYEQDDFN